MSDPAIVTLAGRRVGPGCPTFLVAEVGSNHNRDVGMARRLVDASAEAGWDAVKFQLFRAAWLYPENCGVVDTPAGRVDFFQVLHAVELPPEWLPELKSYVEALGLVFLCTPFDEGGVAELARLGIAGYKIASPELNHLPLLRAAAAVGKPLICSTGISTLQDVDEALREIHGASPEAQVILLQCTSAYPTPEVETNLGVIGTLARAFGVPVGFSDHTLDAEAAPAVAVAAGACLIEKHVTESRALEGPDHSFAIEPPEMKRLERAVREMDALPKAKRLRAASRRLGADRVRALLGHGRKEIMPSEALLYPCDKRSIHAICEIAEGDALSPANIRVVRSERNLRPGLHPRHWVDVLGARLARCVSLGEGIRWEHLLRR